MLFIFFIYKFRPPKTTSIEPTIIPPVTIHDSTSSTTTQLLITTTSSSAITNQPNDHSNKILKCTAENGTKGISYWPPVYPGQFSYASCPKNTTGEAYWYCEKNSRFSQNGPIISCTHEWIKPLMAKIQESSNIDELKKNVNELNEILEKPEIKMKFHGDLKGMVSILQNIQWKTNEFANGSSTPDQHDNVEHITQSLVQSCSKILDHDQLWQNGAKNETVQLAADVLKYVQYAGVTYGCTAAAANLSNNFNNLVINQQEEANIFLSAFNMELEQPIRFAYMGLNFSLTNTIDHQSLVSNICKHSIGVGSIIERLSKYLSMNMTDDFLKINSEIVSFSYNNNSNIYYFPDNTKAEMM